MGCPHANSTYKIHNPIGIRPLTHLRLGVNYLIEHKLRQNLADYVNLLCSCRIKPGTTFHFFCTAYFIKHKII